MRDRSWPTELRTGEHVLQIYSNEREKLLSIYDALDWGGENFAIVYFTDDLDLGRVEESNGDLKGLFEESKNNGNLRILPCNEMLFTDGRLSIEDWRIKWGQVYDEMMLKGFKHILKVVDFSGICGDEEEINDLITMEAHSTLRHLPDNVSKLCQYDSRFLSDDLINKLLAIHEVRLEWKTIKRNFWIMYRRKG